MILYRYFPLLFCLTYSYLLPLLLCLQSLPNNYQSLSIKTALATQDVVEWDVFHGLTVVFIIDLSCSDWVQIQRYSIQSVNISNLLHHKKVKKYLRTLLINLAFVNEVSGSKNKWSLWEIYYFNVLKILSPLIAVHRLQ